ncbi:MAG: TetR/AcrR family transcriptional regulator [Betaproteobacteria bacterium]|nr:TetR/AcrR family transcriptional regulator [Betaproteobacteria bacterium]
MPRTKEYDEAALLDRTMETFWSQGYDGTSIDDLVERTGVNRASLYSVYPDKRALFIAGIKRYLDLVVEDNIRRLREAEPPGEAVRQFFLKLVDAPIERIRRGCLLTNSATELGLEDAEVAALIRGAFRRVERALCDRLVEAQKANQLAAGVHPETLARLLITVLQGIRVMSRVGVDRETMRDAVTGALSGIASAPGTEPAAGRQRQRKTRAAVKRTLATRKG